MVLTSRESDSRAASETARVEAFSDGVFAIAITLLILEIRVPTHDALAERGVPLARALLEQWPSYFAFLTSFLTIGIMWLNHHRLFTLIRRADHTLILLNLLLMLGVTFVPFPTALLAEHLTGPDAHIAAAVYSGTFVGVAIVFNVLWRYAATGMRLIGRDVDPGAVDAQTKQYVFGPVVYLAAFLLAWVSVMASVALNFAIALFFALPPRRAAARKPPTRGEAA